jgi:hypothetical protein
MTMRKLIKVLETHRVQNINGKRLLYPATAEHKKICSAFGLHIP